jgi:hypothetical protein
MSTLKVSTLQNLSGTEVYTCKAWVNFNGSGTVAIRASGNVSSITDNGTGDYTVNLANAMPDANYCPQLTIDTGNRHRIPSQTASDLRVLTYDSGGTIADQSAVFVAIFR